LRSLLRQPGSHPDAAAVRQDWSAFGHIAASGTDPRLCVPRFLRVCLSRKARIQLSLIWIMPQRLRRSASRTASSRAEEWTIERAPMRFMRGMESPAPIDAGRARRLPQPLCRLEGAEYVKRACKKRAIGGKSPADLRYFSLSGLSPGNGLVSVSSTLFAILTLPLERLMISALP